MSDKPKPIPIWNHDDLLYAFEAAAVCMDDEEFGGDEPEKQNAAFREVARRIRAMADRYERKHCK